MNDSVAGAEFRITGAARNKIRLYMQEAAIDEAERRLIPIITWISGMADRDEFIPGPHLGLQYEDKIPTNYPYFYQIDSILVYIMLDEKRISECRTKVLDYRCKRFFLVYGDEL